MKKIIPLLFTSFSLFAYTDFGVHGALYENKESDFKKEMEAEVKKFEKTISQEKVEALIKDQVKIQSFGRTKLQYCSQDSRKKGPNFQTLEQDVLNPLGRVYKKKGEKVLLRSEKPLDVCFIDGTNLHEMKNQIEYFDKTVKELSGQDASCVYMVSNKSVLEIDKMYAPRDFYPTKDVYEQRFDVQCYPTLIHIEDDMKYDYEISMDYFKHKKGE